MFSGNKALLVVSPTLQDYLVDKTTGLPLAAGIVTFYQDNQRQVLKNVYYQQGTPGNYTYTALPNPLTLSAVGTIQDNNGNDVIPYFYPIDETNNTDQQFYYVTVYNSNAVLQFSRQGFPFVPAPEVIPTDEPLLKNYLYNNVFWRNTGANANLGVNTLLAPGAHDGFVTPVSPDSINGGQPSPSPDIVFIKSKTGATDQISYLPFGSTLLPFDVTPEYYVNLQCTATTTGENYKLIQFPVQLHVLNLQNTQMTFTIWAQGTASGSNKISIYLYEFLGIGATTQPAPVIQGNGSIQLNTSWTQYTVPVNFTTSNPNIGVGGDDAWYLQIWFPVNAQFNINIAKPSLFLGNSAPTSQYTPYDEIDSVIGTPRTGDYRISLNNFYPAGWMPANDTAIGSAASSPGTGGLASASAWPLYNLLWNSVGATYAPMKDTNPYGTSAYTDFSANRAILLTKTLGRVLASAGLPSSGNNVGTTWQLGQTTGNEKHTIVEAELAQHNHPGSTFSYPIFNAAGGGTPVVQAAVGAGGSQSITVATDPGSPATPINIQNPVTYLNVFIKL